MLPHGAAPADATGFGIALDECSTVLSCQTCWLPGRSHGSARSIAVARSRAISVVSRNARPLGCGGVTATAVRPIVRYIRLVSRDLSLVHGVLGSCTMAECGVELLPVSWPEFAALHPARRINQGLRAFGSGIWGLASALTGTCRFAQPSRLPG